MGFSHWIKFSFQEDPKSLAHNCFLQVILPFRATVEKSQDLNASNVFTEPLAGIQRKRERSNSGLREL